MILLHTLRARNFKQLRDVTLDFPEDGSVLIEGHNEAGKSTLFEAAFFALYGKPLDSQATQEELKTYHAEEMSVELVFSVDGRRFTVRRALKSNQTCYLEWTEEGETKTLRGASTVNQRIRDEVGLSASAVLNTCFVEQKNLERLESLDRNQRRDAINELLNLRVLTQLEREFAVTAEERREVSRLKEQVEVARLDDAWPRLCEAEREAASCERFARLSELLDQRTAWEAEAAELTEERDSLARERGTVESRLTEARSLAARLEKLKTGLALRLQQWGREMESAARAAERLETLRQQAERLPAAEGRLRTVEEAAERVRQRDEDLREEQRIADAHAGAVRTLASERQRSKEWQARVDGLRESLPALEEACRIAEEREREAGQIAGEAALRDALSAWAEATERSGESAAGADGSDLDAREKDARSRHDSASKDAAAATKRVRHGWIVAGTGLVPGIVGVAIPSMLVALLVVAVILAAAGATMAIRAARVACSLQEQAQAAQRELDGIEGERRAFTAQAERSAQDREAWRKRAEAYGERIRELGAEVPDSASSARRQCGTLTTMPLAEARSAAEGAQATRSEQQSKRDATCARMEAELASPVEVSPELEARVRTLQTQLDELRNGLGDGGEITVLLTPLGLESELSSIDAELKRLRESVASCQSAANDLSSAQQEANRHRDATQQMHRDAAEEWQALMDGAEMPDDAADALRLVRGALDSAGLQAEQADAPGLERRIRNLDARLNGIDVSLGTMQHRIGEANRDISADAAAFGWASDVNAQALTQIRDSHPELAQARARTAVEWAELHRQATVQAQTNRETRAARAASVGIEHEMLDLPSAQEELADSVRAMNVKLRASEIVRSTRASIVGRVMPLTLQNMRRLLPRLTDGRYHDAEWHEEANALTVFDNEARRQVSKRVFSGGARDQISLSLRLAFALATLPGEYSTRPGWLFLDEPLSSFDRERTRHLVDLLTRGLVRDQFSQILLVSHSESFDPAQFDHRIRMEGGRIVTGFTPAAESELVAV